MVDYGMEIEEVAFVAHFLFYDKQKALPYVLFLFAEVLFFGRWLGLQILRLRRNKQR